MNHDRFDTSVNIPGTLNDEIELYLEYGEGNGKSGWIRDAIRRYLVDLAGGGMSYDALHEHEHDKSDTQNDHPLTS